MPKDAATLSRLPNPSRLPLADECAGEYDALLADYCADMRPAGALERRQVELILRCDVDIDRQRRMIAQRLNPLEREETRGAQILAEWHRRALLHPNSKAAWEEPEEPAPAPTPPGGDARLTPLIARQYGRHREDVTLHQRELDAAERRRRQAIELLFRMQDRRRRADIPDAEVVG